MSKQIYGTLGDLRFKDDSRFVNCIIKVCHDGLNKNNSSFDKEDILRCAEQSLRECPILGSVVVDECTGERRLIKNTKTIPNVSRKLQGNGILYFIGE